MANGTFIPVIRDTFIAGLILEVASFARDGEERFEGFFVEVAFWVFGGFVGHQGRGEGEAGGSDEDAGELGEEKVRVGVDGVVEAGLAEGKEGRILLWSWLSGGSANDRQRRDEIGDGYSVLEQSIVVLLEEFNLKQIVIATGSVYQP